MQRSATDHPTAVDQPTRRRRVAVLLAGGVGARVGLNIPKQLIKIAGKTILEHTLVALHDHDDVDEILILMAPGHLDAVHALLHGGRYPKVSQVLEGAETRNRTTQKALAALGEEDCDVLFHDAVRPLVSNRIIRDCFAALADHDAVDVAIPSADTIIEVTSENTIAAVPVRDTLRRGQTPQAFRSSVLAAAYALADQDPDFRATDDCSVVLRYRPDVPIWVVDGEERNLKVTNPVDVYIADKLFQMAGESTPSERTDAALRSSLEGKVVVVLGGSYGIGADIAELTASLGATVCSFSRSATGTHVERREDLVKAADQVVAEYGRIDYVVNTAGVLTMGDLVDTTEETIYSATEVNYLAPIFVAQVFYPHLARVGGSLLLFTSSSYTRGRRGYSLYSSAKAAVVNLTQALAEEWAETGVRVNCVNPERTGTPMRVQAFGEEPAGSLLTSDAVARSSVDVLVSDGTGHVIDLRLLDPLAGDA